MSIYPKENLLKVLSLEFLDISDNPRFMGCLELSEVVVEPWPDNPSQKPVSHCALLRGVLICVVEQIVAGYLIANSSNDGCKVVEVYSKPHCLQEACDAGCDRMVTGASECG